MCLLVSNNRHRDPLQYEQSTALCTLKISHQQHGSPHGQMHSARHDQEGDIPLLAAIKPVRSGSGKAACHPLG